MPLAIGVRVLYLEKLTLTPLSAGFALIFILFKMIFEIIQEAVGYFRRRKKAIYKHRRRPATLDLGNAQEGMLQP